MGILAFYSYGMIAYTADETATLYLNVYRLGHKEFHAATERVDFYLLVFSNDGLAQVHADAAKESVETGSMEWLATIDVFIATIVCSTANALAVLTDRQRAAQPLVGIAAIAFDNEVHTNINQQTDAEIGSPSLLGYSRKPVPFDYAPDCS